MGIFRRHDKSAGEPTEFTVLRGDAFVTYKREDFAELERTTDKLEMERLVGLGWLVLDEALGPGSGPGHEEFHMSGVMTGSVFGGQAARAVPMEMPPDDVTTYTLGYLKDGAVGTSPP